MNNDLKQFYNSSLRDDDNVLSTSAKARVKEKILANLGVQFAAEQKAPLNGSIIEKLKRFFMLPYVMVPLVILLFVGGTSVASAEAQPGDKLYGVKRQVERLQLLTAPDDEARLRLEINFAERRLEEARIVEEKRLRTQLSAPSQNSVPYTGEVDLEAFINDPHSESEPLIPLAPATATEGRQQQYEAKIKSKLKVDARHAIEVLTKIKQSYLNKGQTDKARQIDVLLRKYFHSKTPSSHHNDGHVQGAQTDAKAETDGKVKTKHRPDPLPQPVQNLNLNLNLTNPTPPPRATNPPATPGGSYGADRREAPHNNNGASEDHTDNPATTPPGSTGSIGNVIGGIGGLFGF